MVAHFDYYYDVGGTSVSYNGILLIAKDYCSNSKMANNNDTAGAYVSSIAHTTACPAIATALSTVLGSYLLSVQRLLSNQTNNNTPSMVGAGMAGASTSWTWESSQCELPNTVQLGVPDYNSSFRDIGVEGEKLAVFNFISYTNASRKNAWLRSVFNSTMYTKTTMSGYIDAELASRDQALRPIIYIG